MKLRSKQDIIIPAGTVFDNSVSPEYIGGVPDVFSFAAVVVESGRISGQLAVQQFKMGEFDPGELFEEMHEEVPPKSRAVRH